MILDMIARLPGLTEVDGSMIPLEELDDTTKRTRSWHGAGCIDCDCVFFTRSSCGHIYILTDLTKPERIRLEL